MARQVNTKFLTIITVVVLAGLGLAYAIPKVLERRFNPRQLYELAQKYEQQGSLKQATEFYGKAVDAEPRNVIYRVKFGDMLHSAAHSDQRAVEMWEAVLEDDPKNAQALKRLLDVYILAAENASNSALETEANMRLFTRLQARAKMMAQLDPKTLPDDMQSYPMLAKAWAQIATIEQWVYGASKSEAEIEKTITALKEMIPQAPDLVVVPQYAAQAYVKMGRSLRDQGLGDAAEARFDQARGIFDAAMKLRPDSPILCFRYFQTLQLCAPSGSIENEKKYAPAMKTLIDKASSLVEKSDRLNYIDIKVAAAQFLLRGGNPKETLDVMKSLREEFPDSLVVQVTYGALLRNMPSRRDEAIEVLSKVVEDPTLGGFRGRQRARLDFRRASELLHARIDSFKATADAEAKQQIRQQINDDYARVTSFYDPKEQSAEIMKLRGRILLLDNTPASNIDAVKYLKGAHDLFEKGRVFDEETTLYLAEAFFALHEYGQARIYAAEVVSRRPREVIAHKLLANVLIVSGQSDLAIAQLDELEKMGIKDADVTRMRIATLKGADQKADSAKLLEQLPENSAAEKFSKARVALSAGDKDTAKRLLKVVQQQQDWVIPATRLLVQVYLSEKDEAGALAAVDDGLKVKPGDKLLILTRGIVQKPSPEERRKLQEEWIGDMADETDRELRLYDLERSNNNPAEALKHLTVARDKNPEDGRVLRAVFEYDLNQKNFDDAAKCLDKLTALNWDHMNGLRFKYQYSLARGQLNEALAAAQKMTTDLSEFAYTWLLRGDVEQALGQYEQAAGSYAKALEREGNSAPALRGLINCGYQRNQPETARQYIAVGMKIFPESREFKEMDLRHQESFGDPERVTDQRKKQLKENDKSLDAWIGLARNYLMCGASRNKRSDTAAANNFFDLAKSTLNDAKSRGDWGDHEDIYRLLDEIGLQANKPEDSIAALKELVARPAGTTNYRGNLLLAQRYASVGKYDEAELEFKNALAKSNNDVKLQLELARFYDATMNVVKGQAEKAITLLDSVFASTKDLTLLKKSLDLQIRAGQADRAEKTINEQLALHPDDTDLITLQGLLFMSHQEIPKAEERFTAALKVDPNNARARFSLGVIYLSSRKFDAAIEQLTVASKQSSTADVHSALAEAYAQKGDIERSISELELVLRQNIQNGPARTRLIQLYTTAGNVGRADQLLDEAEKNPKLSNNPVWFKLHAQRLMNSNPDLALDKIRRAVQLAPNDLDILYLNLELLLRNKGYQEGLQLSNKLAQSKELESDWRVHMYRGTFLYYMQQKDDGFNEFDKALNLSSDNDAANNLTVQRFIQSAGMPEAISRAAERAKDDVRWRIMLAVFYNSDRKADLAIKTINDVMDPAEQARLSPERKEQAYRAAGMIYLAHGEEDRSLYDKAINVYNLYLAQLIQMGDKANPEARFWVLNNLAYLTSERLKQPEKALQYSTMAMDLMRQTNTSSAPILDTHGWILVQCKKLDEAIGVLNKAAERDPSLPDAAFHLGEAYILKNLPERAQEELGRASRLLDAQKKNGQPVDELMRSKITSDLERAANLLRSGDVKDKTPGSKTP